MMAWLKVDEKVRSHPKLVKAVQAAGGAAGWYWLCGLAYAREHSTDGFLAEDILSFVAPGLKAWKKCPDALVAANLWTKEPGGYQIRDYADWNPTKDQLRAHREADAERKRVDRAGSVRDVSKRTHGERPDPRADAGVQAGASSPSPSLSLDDGSTSVIERTPEGGPGETAHHPPLPRRVSVVDRANALGLVSPGAWERQHGTHALRADLCDWVCLPAMVHDEWQRRLVAAGATAEDAARDIRTWALGVRAQWAGRVPGDDIFAFWRNEWQKQHGSNRPASVAKAGGGLDALIGGLRG